MTSPEIAEEVLDDFDVLRARDPRGLLPAVAVAASVLRALLGPSSPVTVDVVPGPVLPVWAGPTDIAVVATRTGAGRYAVTPAYDAARRGVALLGIGAEGAPLH